MEGLSNYIAALSVDMAQYNVQSQASLAVLKNTMDSQAAAESRLIEDLSDMTRSADGSGALLDVRA